MRVRSRQLTKTYIKITDLNYNLKLYKYDNQRILSAKPKQNQIMYPLCLTLLDNQT